MNDEQLQKWRAFANHMGSDISVRSIQYQLAEMVWTLVDEVRRLQGENKAMEETIKDLRYELIEGQLQME